MTSRHTFQFTFKNLETQFREVIDRNYKVITCAEYIDEKLKAGQPRLFVNRVDIDMSVKKAERLAIVFNNLDIRATFFLRLHATEYNPFSFENYRIVRFIVESGHELGYHSEVVDGAIIWGEDPDAVLGRDLRIIREMFGVSVKGVASHGGMTGLNNLDFWKERSAAEFGLLYEAYDKEPAFNLFHEALYVSDSCWTHWKCYENGILVEGDQRSLAEHARTGPPVIYSLIHPETYFDRHFYE